MKLSIIIVSWNTKELTLKCLKSIYNYLKDLNFEIFLVDNNSTDNTISEVEKLNYHNLKIIKNKQNLGFAKANNQALRLVLSEAKEPVKKKENHYILLLNSDTELIDSSLIRMIKFLENPRDPSLRSGQVRELVIVGPKLLNSDKTLQRSCRRFPKLLDQFLIQLKFYNFFPEKFKSIREYFMLDFKHDEIQEVNQIMGAVMLIKKGVIEKIGLLDENFWAIFEEVDFCKRASNAGYKIYFYPETKILHHKESSFKQIKNLKKQINFNHSLYYYFKKHKPFWQLFILWLVQPINLLLTIINIIFKIRERKGKKKDL